MVEPILAAQDTWFSQGDTTVKRASITEIHIKDTYTPTGTVTSSWDASAAKDGSVMAYVEGTKLTIAGNGYGRVYANPDSTAAFSSTGADQFIALTTITGSDLLDTNKVTTMKTMFRHCTSLVSLDTRTWDTSNVSDFSGMFCGNSYSGDMKITSILGVEDWDTSSATNMMHLFYGCGQLIELDLSKWDVSKVTTMTHMFADCFKMERYNFSGWNTASLTDMDAMFNDNHALISIDISDFDTGKVTKFSQLFEHCSNLTSVIGLDKLDTSSANTFSEMFRLCSSLITIDVSTFTTSSLESTYHMFEECVSLTAINGLENWNTEKLQYSEYMFCNCSSLTELNISSWNTTNFRNYQNIFAGCSNLKTIYVSERWVLKWSTMDPSEDEYLQNTFLGCTSLVGGAGTAYSGDNIHFNYAHIDGGLEDPGYFTNVDDPTQLLIQTGTLHKLGLSVRGVTGDISKYTTSEMIDTLKSAGEEINVQSTVIDQIISDLENLGSSSYEPGIPVAKIDEQEFYTVEDALKAAQPGETVTLIADSDEANSYLVVGNNIKLDLAGHSLTANSLTTALDADVYDNTDSTVSTTTLARLIVPKGSLFLQPKNSKISFWDDINNSYVFLTPRGVTDSGGVTVKLANVTTDGFQVLLRPNFGYLDGQSINSVYMPNGGKDNEISIKIRISWSKNEIETYQIYEFSDSNVASSYPSAAMRLTMRNVEQNTMYATVIVSTDSGVEFEISSLTYTKPTT